MTDLDPDRHGGTPRRSLFARLAGATAIGLGGLVSTPSRAQPAAAASDGPHWPGTLKARHRQVVDAYEVNGGAPLEFAYTFIATNPPATAMSVIVLRARALVLALDNPIWQKYQIGESFKIIDPETKAPAVKNPFLRPKPGIMHAADAALDRMLANGAIFGACSVALHGQAKALASSAGVSAEDAVKEWVANVVPGITIIPSGVWGLNRAQEAGCSYCSGG